MSDAASHRTSHLAAADGWHAEGDRARGGGALGLGALAAQEGQGEVDSLDLTAPAFVGGALPAGDQVGLEFVEARKHPGVNREHRAPDDPLTEPTEEASGFRPGSTDSDVAASPGPF
jgi:hypothetical protein